MNSGNEPLLRVLDLTVEYPHHGGGKIHAVSGVSFELAKGETLALVGESGCGKSSLARAVMQLPPPTGGSVVLDETDLTRLSGGRLRELRGGFQMVFQDPVSSLNPLRSVGESVAAPLRENGTERTERRRRAEEMLAAVGLDPNLYYDRRPFQLSGGQCQRVSIARALITQPRLLVCDEPVSSLDVSVQAQIVNLLRELKKCRFLSLLFISHDLAVVKNISDRVAVMYLGRLCETGPVEKIYANPAHPYTAALLAAAPYPDPDRPLPVAGQGAAELPSAVVPPSGCRFRTRCPRADAGCADEIPQLEEIAPGRLAACRHPMFRQRQPKEIP